MVFDLIDALIGGKQSRKIPTFGSQQEPFLEYGESKEGY